MSTVDATSAEVALPAASDHGHAGVVTMVRSEWTKFRSVRSSWISLLIIVVVGIGFAALFSAVFADHWTKSSPGDRLGFDPVRISQAGSFVSQIVVGVLGALIITSEYSTGSIRTTLAGIPKRTSMATAKAIVLGVVLLIVTEITAFASFFTSYAVLLASGGKQISKNATIASQLNLPHVPVLSITYSGVAMAVFREAIFLTLMGLFAMGLGLLLRNTTGTISPYVGILLVIPILAQLLPSSINQHILPYLPSNLGVAMSSVTSRHTDFAGNLVGPYEALGLAVLYVVVVVSAGIVLLRRRDA